MGKSKKSLKDARSALRPSSYGLLVFIILAIIFLLLFSRTRRDVEPERKPVSPPKTEQPVEKKPPKPDKGRIAIIIDDFGYNLNSVTQAFLKLDADLTYAIIPGLHYSQRFAREASEAGYEIMIHMPMESDGKLHVEEGYILETSMTSAEIERRVQLAIDSIPQASGMNNHQGSKATQDARLMNIVGTLLKHNNKYFIDSRTTAETIAEEKIGALEVPVTSRDIFLDNDSDPLLIRQQVDEMIRVADKRGSVVGIGHGRPATLQVLQTEIPRLKADGYRFVFASRIVRK